MNKRLEAKLKKLAEKDNRLELLRKKAGFVLDTNIKECLVCNKIIKKDEISFCCDECKEYFLNCIINNKAVSIRVNKQLIIETKKYTEVDEIKKKYQQHLAPIPFKKKVIVKVEIKEENTITEQEAIIGTDETPIF